MPSSLADDFRLLQATLGEKVRRCIGHKKQKALFILREIRSDDPVLILIGEPRLVSAWRRIDPTLWGLLGRGEDALLRRRDILRNISLSLFNQPTSFVREALECLTEYKDKFKPPRTKVQKLMGDLAKIKDRDQQSIKQQIWSALNMFGNSGGSPYQASEVPKLEDGSSYSQSFPPQGFEAMLPPKKSASAFGNILGPTRPYLLRERRGTRKRLREEIGEKFIRKKKRKRPRKCAMEKSFPKKEHGVTPFTRSKVTEKECSRYFSLNFLVHSTPRFLKQISVPGVARFREALTKYASPLCIAALTDSSCEQYPPIRPGAALNFAEKNLSNNGVVAVLILHLDLKAFTELLHTARKLKFKIFNRILTAKATDCSSEVHVCFFSKRGENEKLSNMPLFIDGTPSSLLDEENCLAFRKIRNHGDRWRSIGVALEFLVKRFGRLVENGGMLSEILDASGTSQVPVTPVAIQYGLQVVSLSRTASEVENVRENFELAVGRKKLHPVEFIVRPLGSRLKSATIPVPKNFVVEQMPPWRQRGSTEKESEIFNVYVDESANGSGLYLSRPVKKDEVILPCWGKVVSKYVRESKYENHAMVISLEFLYYAGLVSDPLYLVVDDYSLARFVNSPRGTKNIFGGTMLKKRRPNCFLSPEFSHKNRIKELCDRYQTEENPKVLEEYFLDPTKIVVLRAITNLKPRSCGFSKAIELLLDYGSTYRRKN